MWLHAGENLPRWPVMLHIIYTDAIVYIGHHLHDKGSSVIAIIMHAC